jgi:putative membrane protein
MHKSRAEWSSVRYVIRWLFVSWLANAVVLGITGWILSGVTFHGSGWTLIWSALVFGVLNTVLKPILKLLTLPFAVLTLGIAWFFVSMLMLWLTQLIIGGFDIHGFWNYVWATIIVWAVNLAIDLLFRGEHGRAGAPATA